MDSGSLSLTMTGWQIFGASMCVGLGLGLGWRIAALSASIFKAVAKELIGKTERGRRIEAEFKE